MNVLIAVPTYENISPETFKSIYDIEKIPGWNFDFEFVTGYDCARARNKIAHMAIEKNYDYVLMVDSDIVLPTHCLTNLFEINRDIVLGYYPRKKEPDKTDVFRLHDIDYKAEDRYAIKEIATSKDKRIPVHGGGFGCALVNINVFKKMSYPYFCYVNYNDGRLLSEDLYFCTKAASIGYMVFVDTRVKCGHVGKNVIYC